MANPQNLAPNAIFQLVFRVPGALPDEMRRRLRQAFADRLMEFSVLMAVFPALDFANSPQAESWWIPLAGLGFALISLAGGLYLKIWRQR